MRDIRNVILNENIVEGGPWWYIFGTYHKNEDHTVRKKLWGLFWTGFGKKDKKNKKIQK